MTAAMAVSTVLVASATGGQVQRKMAVMHGTATCTIISLMSTVATPIRSTASPCVASGIDYLSCEIWNISQDILDYWGDNKVGGYAPLSVANKDSRKFIK